MVSAIHPLAAALIERLQSRRTIRILDFAAGNGRNADALRDAGFIVFAIDDATAASKRPLDGIEDTFDAAISTHGLLHGDYALIVSHVEAISGRLEPGGLLYATFGSTRDRRFGRGERIDDWSFAPLEGDERGVTHAYFERGALGELLERTLEIESLEERAVDDIAGKWAHREFPLEKAVHWFVRSRKR